VTFEQTMSALVAAIGNVERLETVSQEQYDRLKLQCDRLNEAIYDHWPTADVDD
jgi:hypothetical protein